MRHTPQEHLKRNRKRSNIIVMVQRGEIKEAVAYAVKENVDPKEFGKVAGKHLKQTV